MDVALRAAVGCSKSQFITNGLLAAKWRKCCFDFYDEYVEFTRQVLLDSLAKGGFHTNQMAVISDGIVKRFKQVGVDDKTAGIFC